MIRRLRWVERNPGVGPTRRSVAVAALAWPGLAMADGATVGPDDPCRTPMPRRPPFLSVQRNAGTLCFVASAHAQGSSHPTFAKIDEMISIYAPKVMVL